jgi:ferredoxin
VADDNERVVGGLKIRLNRSLCVGFADCTTTAPDAFALDADGIVTFSAPEGVGREQLISACDACPVDAITVWDETGRAIVP